MRSPSSSTGATASAAMPCCCAERRAAASTLPRAALAEGEIVAGDDARRADLLGQQLGDEILGAGRGQRARRSRTPASRRRRRGRTAPRAGRGVVRRNGGTSGLKKRTGCGSKVATITGRRSWKPRATARPTTAWWPRWKPSKLPSATMLPRKLRRGSAGRGSAAASCIARCIASSVRPSAIAGPLVTAALDSPRAQFLSATHPDPPVSRRRIRARVGFSFEDAGFLARRWGGFGALWS